MDPLSITTACVGLVTTISKVSITVNGFVREVRDARGDLDAVSRELLSLKTILELLSDDAERSTGGGFPQSLIKQISGILKNCHGVLEQIESSLQKHSGGGVKKGVKWSLSGRDDMNKLRSSLEAHKSALDIALDMIALSIAREIKTDTEELRNDTAAIKSDTAQILAEIARLQAKLPEDDQVHGGAGFTLQRYLDNLSSYAETSCNLSDIESDSGVHLETSQNGLSSQNVTSEDSLYDTSLLERRHFKSLESLPKNPTLDGAIEEDQEAPARLEARRAGRTEKEASEKAAEEERRKLEEERRERRRKQEEVDEALAAKKFSDRSNSRSRRRKDSPNSYDSRSPPPRRSSKSVADVRQVNRQGRPILHFARALYKYQAAIPEELSFAKGDILAVLRLQDDGWWEAEVTGENGRPGLVPSNYVQNC